MLLLVFGATVIYAQKKQMTDVNVLAISHKNKEKVKYIQEGKRVVYWLKDERKKQKGKYTFLNDSTITVDGNVVPLADLRKIGGRTIGGKIVDIAGATVLGTGTIVSGFGVYLIYFGSHYTSDDYCNEAMGQIIYVFIGAATVIIGATGVIIGGIPLLITGKRYNLETKWDIEKGIIQKKVKVKE